MQAANNSAAASTDFFGNPTVRSTAPSGQQSLSASPSPFPPATADDPFNSLATRVSNIDINLAPAPAPAPARAPAVKLAEEPKPKKSKNKKKKKKAKNADSDGSSDDERTKKTKDKKKESAPVTPVKLPKDPDDWSVKYSKSKTSMGLDKIIASWKFRKFGRSYEIELSHSLISGKRTIKIDGVVRYSQKKFFDTGSRHPITLGHGNQRVTCNLMIAQETSMGFTYDLEVMGVSFQKAKMLWLRSDE